MIVDNKPERRASKKSMKKQLLIISTIILCSLCFFGGRVSKRCDCIAPISDTIYIERTDTIRFASEVDFTHKTEKVVETRYVEVHDTIVKDSIVFMPIEITQKWYHEDSLCDVWVSGYEPNLDSLHLYQKHTTEIVNHFREVTKMPRFTAEVGLQGLYLQDRLVGSVGCEVRYNAPKMSYSAFGCYTTDKKAVVGVGVGYRFNLVK